MKIENEEFSIFKQEVKPNEVIFVNCKGKKTEDQLISVMNNFSKMFPENEIFINDEEISIEVLKLEENDILNIKFNSKLDNEEVKNHINDMKDVLSSLHNNILFSHNDMLYSIIHKSDQDSLRAIQDIVDVMAEKRNSVVM